MKTYFKEIRMKWGYIFLLLLYFINIIVNTISIFIITHYYCFVFFCILLVLTNLIDLYLVKKY